jgi:hypothetical protein
MRFPVPFTSFPLFSLFGKVCQRIPTFGNVKRVPTCVISWFLVCFWGRVRLPSGGRSSLSLFALRWVLIHSLPPVWCFSLIWTDGRMTSSNDSFFCASFYLSVFILVCRILINSFRFSLFYTESPTKAKRPAYLHAWVWFEPSLYFFMERW